MPNLTTQFIGSIHCKKIYLEKEEIIELVDKKI